MRLHLLKILNCLMKQRRGKYYLQLGLLAKSKLGRPFRAAHFLNIEVVLQIGAVLESNKDLYYIQ